MLYSLKGEVIDINPPNRLILKTQFINWEILIPFNLVEKVKNELINKIVELYVISIIKRGEYIEIYGFLKKEEREFFIKLINLSKVGPKIALNLLSVFSPDKLRKIILNRDIQQLSIVPGIGPKRAEKLYLELKNLFSKTAIKKLGLPIEKIEILEEAKICLLGLGFQKKEIEKVLSQVFTEKDSLDTLIKKALQKLSPYLYEESYS